MSTTAVVDVITKGRNAIATNPTPKPASPKTTCAPKMTTAPRSQAAFIRRAYRHTDCSINTGLFAIAGNLHEEARPSANGIAIFACAGASNFFEAVQLDAPIDQHQLFVSAGPRLLPLARLADRYQRYAAVVLDTQSARIFVVGLGALEAAGAIEGEKTRRTEVGGWSQARYQRHVDNFALHHVKEVIDALDETARAESVRRVVFAGDEIVVPLVRDQLPKA